MMNMGLNHTFSSHSLSFRPSSSIFSSLPPITLPLSSMRPYTTLDLLTILVPIWGTLVLVVYLLLKEQEADENGNDTAHNGKHDHGRDRCEVNQYEDEESGDEDEIVCAGKTAENDEADEEDIAVADAVAGAKENNASNEKPPSPKTQPNLFVSNPGSFKTLSESNSATSSPNIPSASRPRWISKSTSRRIRLILWPLGMIRTAHWLMARRFNDPNINYLNFMLGCAGIFFMLILTNFAFLKTPPKRLACSNGPSSASYTLADAFHLCSSTRLVGWTDGLPLNTPTQAFIEAVQAGRTEKNGTPLDGRSLNAQWQSHEYTRNIKMWFLHFFMMDITLYIYQTVFGSTYGDPVKGGDMYIECGKVLDYSYRRFLLSNSTSSSTSSLSQSTFALAVMDFLISQTYFAIIVTSLGFAFYTALCVGYHTVVIIGMTLGFGAEEWPRLMDSPWKATGLIDFWGKRWHQTFRSGFTAPIHLVPKHYRSLAAPFIAFSLSAIMHELGALPMAGTTSPGYVVSRFFLAQAFGMLTEILWMRAVGKRVDGLLGRVWFWTFILTTGRQAARFWLCAGIGGGRIIPENLSLVTFLDRKYLHLLPHW